MNKSLLRILSAFFMLVIFPSIVMGEMHLITKNDGLAGRTVGCIVKDRLGRIWIGTSNGVDVYNGRRILNVPLADCPVRPGRIFDLVEGDNNRIYLSSRHGLYKLDVDDDAFKRILPEISDPENLFFSDGKLYIGNHDGLSVYDGKRLRNIPFGPSKLSLDNSVRRFAKGTDGNIWFLSRKAINTYNPKTGKTTSRNLSQLFKNEATMGNIAFSGGNIYLTVPHSGLFVYDYKHNKARRIEKVGTSISRIYAHKEGPLCVATEGYGAFVVDGKTGAVLEHYGTEEADGHHLESDLVSVFQRDEAGINWFGFVRNGLAYTYFSLPLFKTYSFKTFSTLGMPVRTACFNGKERLFGNTHGFVYIDEGRGICREYNPGDLSGAHDIINICKWKGKYYLGTSDKGLYIFDPATLSVSAQHFNDILNTCNVTSINVSPDGQLCIGTSEGLFVVNEDNSVRRYTEQTANIVGSEIRGILFDKNRNAWLYGSKGLSMWLRDSRSFVNSQYPKGFFNKDRLMKGRMLHDGNIWFSTGTQFFHTNLLMTQFDSLRLPTYMYNEDITDFADNARRQLWVLSDKGLFLSSDYKFDNVRYFSPADGIYADTYYTLGFTDNGQLYVGSSNGLMLMEKAFPRKKGLFYVELYNIRKNGEMLPLSMENVANLERTIRLSWNFTSDLLQAKPIVSDYSHPTGRLYEYCVDGSKKWNVVEETGEILFPRLFLGSHKVKIRLAGMPETETTFSIVVSPSVAAVLEFLLLVIAIVLLMLWKHYRHDTKVMLAEREQIENALIESEELRVKSEDSKYQRVKYDEKECEDIVKSMKDYIEKSHAWRNPELKRENIAKAIHVPVAKLSQIFTLYLQQNYYDFINAYRLREFKELISQGEYKRYTITALSERCGFKRSSFFSTFHKVEHMTPNEYLKSKNIKL